MVRAETLALVRSTCESVLDHRGIDLVDFSLRREGKGLVLRITVDRETEDAPVTLDEIADISEEISRALDRDDPIEVRYTLEVSSAGLERPLVKPGDYVRFKGRQVRLKTEQPVEGSKVWTGSIIGSDDSGFDLQTDSGVSQRFEFGNVAKVNLVVDWEEEFRRAK